MPITNKQQTQKAESNTPAPKKHKALIIVAGLTIVSVILFFISWGGMEIDRMGMEKYLEDKYGQEFKVTDLEDRAVALGDPGQRVGIGRPTNDGSLTFEVGKSLNTGVYFDGYSGAVWEREESLRVTAFLKTIYETSQIPNFDLSIGIPTSAAPDPIRGKVPTIDNAMIRYKDNFFYNIALKLTTDHELSQNEINDHTEKLKQTIDFVLAKKISSPSVSYAIYIQNQKMGYFCNLYKDELTDQKKIDNCLINNLRKTR